MSMKVTKEQFIGVTYDELLAENEKLWALNEHMGLKDMAVIGGLEEENERLKADNAKLRELVRELWRTMDLLNACDVSEYDEPLNCIYCEQWGTVGKNIVGCKLKYRMCELGVDA